jgi:hypothetical protein
MSTYFDWGIGPNSETQYGLWNPVLDRFLLVLCNKEFGTTIKYISSSRYILYLVDLSTSSNYTSGLIDNTCCQNWTISNKKDIKLSKPQDYDVVSAELVTTDADANWDVEKEKQWLQFIWDQLKFLQDLQDVNPWYKYSRFLNSIGVSGTELNESDSFYNDVTATENYILKSLYLGDTIKDTELAIKNYISQVHPLINIIRCKTKK